MPRRLAQQRITLSDLECPFHASCSISAVAAELLVIDSMQTKVYLLTIPVLNLR